MKIMLIHMMIYINMMLQFLSKKRIIIEFL